MAEKWNVMALCDIAVDAGQKWANTGHFLGFNLCMESAQHSASGWPGLPQPQGDFIPISQIGLS